MSYYKSAKQDLTPISLGGTLGGVAGAGVVGTVSGALGSVNSGLMVFFKTINAAKGGVGGAVVSELITAALRNAIDECPDDGCG